VPDDDRMLERLGRALAPPPAQPDEGEVRTVHHLVARFRARRARADEADPSVLSSDRSVTHLPPAVLRTPAAAADAGTDLPGGSWPGDLRLLA
jgi:hypothetical protein